MNLRHHLGAGLLLFLALGFALARAEYNPISHPASDPSRVRIDVSIDTQMAYVMEGSRPLFVCAICSGKAGFRTPLGFFHVTDKNAHKRSDEYGFWRRDGAWVHGSHAERPEGAGDYVGYPMPWWVGFANGIGFHGGFVWPEPRSHGCIRVPFNVASKLYALVRVGTPVSVARSQPEDDILGHNAPRPDDWSRPDPPNSVMIGDAMFER